MKKRFVVIEGFDGAGKTDASKWVTTQYSYTYVKSPAGAFATARDIFDNLENATVRERFLYYLAVSMSSSATVNDMLTDGRDILLDRYFYSTLVYHEILSPGITEGHKSYLSQLIKPDLVIYLITDFEIALERLKKRKNGANDDLFFKKNRYYQALSLYQRYFIDIPPAQIVIVENNGTFEELTNALDKILKE